MMHRGLSRDGINSCVQVLSLLSNPSLLEADELLQTLPIVVVSCFSPSFHSWHLFQCFSIVFNHAALSFDSFLWFEPRSQQGASFSSPLKHPGPQVASGRNLSVPMGSHGTVREISNPLGVIDELFAHERNYAKDQNQLPPGKWNEKAHFLRSLQLADEENFAKIPCLNDVAVVEDIAPFTLVRYRCLVQDIFEPEMYNMFLLEKDGASQRLVTTKYRESYFSEGKDLQEVGRGGLSSRGAYYCVPLPGETAWSRATSKQQISKVVVSSTKRGRDEDVDMEGQTRLKTVRQRCLLVHNKDPRLMHLCRSRRKEFKTQIRLDWIFLFHGNPRKVDLALWNSMMKMQIHWRFVKLWRFSEFFVLILLWRILGSRWQHLGLFQTLEVHPQL